MPGQGLGEFYKAQLRISQLLTKTFYAPLLAPSQVLCLRDVLSNLLRISSRLLRENSNPGSGIFRSDNRGQANLLLKVASTGLVDALVELESLVEIQKGVEDRSELRWWSWVAALKMAGLFDGGGDGDGDGGGQGDAYWNVGGLVGVRRRLEEVLWRVAHCYDVLTKCVSLYFVTSGDSFCLCLSLCVSSFKLWNLSPC